MSLEDVFKEFEEEEPEKKEEELIEKKEQQTVLETSQSEPKVEFEVKEEDFIKEEELPKPKPEVKPKTNIAEALVDESLVEREVTFEFPSIEEDTESDKEIHLIYGDKGKGKTTLAFGYPGEIVCLSFDNKSARIKRTMFNNDKRIHIFNVTKYMNYDTPDKMLETATKTYEYIKAVLEHAKQYNPDWIVFDGAEIFSQICEWRMRYKHGIKAFAGITNFNIWKERRMYIRQIHNMALRIAKKGIIYTTFTTKDSIVISGEVVTQKDVPKWIDVLMFETDYVIHVDTEPGTFRQLATIITSKDKSLLKTGRVYDVTDKTLWEAVKE